MKKDPTKPGRIQHAAFFLLLLVSVSSALASAPAFTDFSPTMRMVWSFEEQSIRIKLIVKLANTWAAVGFGGQQGSMTQADIAVGEFAAADSSVQIARDYWANSNSRPSLDTALGGAENVVLKAASSVGQETTYEFVRPLSASDAYDKAITDSVTNVIYAHGTQGQKTLSKHATENRNSVQLNLFDLGTCVNDCSGNGICNVETDVCECSFGFTGADCSELDYLRQETISNTFSIAWRIIENTIRIRMTANVTNTWAAIGFDQVGGMTNADMAIGEFNTTNPTAQIVRDYWSVTTSKPTLDTANPGGINNVVFLRGSSNGTTTVYEFERPLTASDVYDKAIKNSSMNAIYAHGSANQKQLAYHSAGYRSSFVINFYSTGKCPNNCSGNGVCNTFVDQCKCSFGFTGADCSELDYLREEPISSTFSIAWRIIENTIRIRMTANVANTWAAIGFDQVDGMTNADMAIGEFDTTNPTAQIVRDYWSVTTSKPTLDTANPGGINNVVFLRGSSNGTTTVYEFERPLAASDVYDKAIKTTSMNAIYAHGSANQKQLAYHSAGYRSSFVINFYSTGKCSNDCGPNGKCNTLTGECICQSGFLPPNCLPIGKIYRYSAELLTGYRMEWTIENQKSTNTSIIYFRLITSGIRWAAIAIDSSDDGMKDADMIIGTFDSQGIGSVQDYYSSSYERPSLDTAIGGVDNILSYVAYNDGSQSVYEFSRYLDTGDKVGDKKIPSSGEVIIGYALGNDGDTQLQKHSLGNAGAKLINFNTGLTKDIDEVDKRQLHAIFMTAGYAIFMLSGIFVARYLKIHILDWWFRLHILLMVIGVTCVAVGFGLAINMVKGEHLAYTHSWVGLFTVVLSGCQVFLGYLADKLFDINRNSTPFFPDKFHWWVGRITIVMAFVAIFLGLDVLEVNDAFYIGFGVVLGLFVVIFLYMEYTWKSPDPHLTVPLIQPVTPGADSTNAYYQKV